MLCAITVFTSVCRFCVCVCCRVFNRRLLQTLNHPNLVHFIGMTMHDEEVRNTFEGARFKQKDAHVIFCLSGL